MKKITIKSISTVLAIIMMLSMFSTVFAVTTSESSETSASQSEIQDETKGTDDGVDVVSEEVEATESVSNNEEKTSSDTVSSVDTDSSKQDELNDIDKTEKKSNKKGKVATGADYGSCGNNVSYRIVQYSGNTYKVLYIMGSGNMSNYADAESTPWFGQKIDRIYIDYQVTSIGNYAFSKLYNLTTVIGAKNVTYIGKNAFSDCYKLQCFEPRKVTFGTGTNISYHVDPLSTSSSEALKLPTNLSSSDPLYAHMKLKSNESLSETTLSYPSIVNNNTDPTIGLSEIVMLPSTLSAGTNAEPASIRQNAFANCYSIKFVGWDFNNTTPSIKVIGAGAFSNCVGIRYFCMPDSVRTIVGYIQKDAQLGAFQVTSDGCKVAQTGQKTYKEGNSKPTIKFSISTSLTLGISNNSYLEQIQDFALSVSAPKQQQVLFNNTTKVLGANIFNTTNSNGLTPKTIGENDKFVFKYMKYIGEQAIQWRYNFTGILQFGDENKKAYPTIATHAFIWTNLTDLYFRWKPQNDNLTNPNGSNYWSSIIGSSAVYLEPTSQNPKGYLRSNPTNLPTDGQNSDEWHSLYTILENQSDGLFEIWKKNLKSINEKNDYNKIFKKLYTPLVTNPDGYIKDQVPNTLNGYSKAIDPNTNKESKDFLNAEVKWTGYNGIAQEDVYFEYQNAQPIDFVFVVDFSGSMDRTAPETATDVQPTKRLQTASKDLYNASRLMNAYAILTNFSKKVLKQEISDSSIVQNSNTVSIISFGNDARNSMEDSSHKICEAQTGWGSVKNALFNYHPPENDATNFSSGFRLAYKQIDALQKSADTQNHKQICIFISDGVPANKLESTSAENNNTPGTDKWDIISGTDWAAAIMDDKIVDKRLRIRSAINGNTTIGAFSTQYNINAANRTSIYNSSTNKYKVHSQSTYYSYYDKDRNGNNLSNMTTYSSVSGLGVPIYGVDLQGEGMASLNYAIGVSTKGFADAADYNSRGDNERSFKVENMEDLSQKLNTILNETTNENYYVTIPLDKNFTLATDTSEAQKNWNIRVDCVWYQGNEWTSSVLQNWKTDHNKLKDKYCLTEDDIDEGDTSLYDGGFVKYDSSRNAIIWNLSKIKDENNDEHILSGAYNIYKLSFYIKYLGVNGGEIIDNSSSYTDYVSVNNNGKSTSLNNAPLQSLTARVNPDEGNGIYTNISSNGDGTRDNNHNATYPTYKEKSNNPDTNIYGYGDFTNTYNSNTSGIYAFIADYTKPGTQTEQFETANHGTNEQNGQLRSVVDALYLPLYELRINKSINGPSNYIATRPKFEIYKPTDKTVKNESNIEYEKMKFNKSSGFYLYSLNGTYTETDAFSGNKSFYYLPPGKYYIYESVYPTCSNPTPYEYTWLGYDSHGNLINGNKSIGSESNGSIAPTIEVIINAPQNNDPSRATVSSSSKADNLSTNSSNPNVNKLALGQITQTVINGYVQVNYNIQGRKTDPEGNPVSGAKVALYTTVADAQAGNDQYVGTPAYTNTDGYYTLSTDTVQNYYVGELETPDNYTKENVLYADKYATVPSSGLVNVGVGGTYKIPSSDNLINMPATTVNIYVNSSDGIKEDFLIYVTGNIHEYGRDMRTGVNPPVNHPGYTDTNGHYSVTVPAYIYVYGGYKKYDSWIIQEVGLGTSSNPTIPDRYFTTQYSDASFDNVKVDNGKSAEYTVDVVNNKVPTVYIYNPSIKINVNNYSAEDRSTPLTTSTFTRDSTMQGPSNLQNNNDGSYSAYGWYGYGTHAVTQTKVKEGYNLNKSPAEFTMDSSSEYIEKRTSAGNRYYEYNVTVYNSRKPNLPYTGGNNNSLWYVLIPLILMSLGFACLTVFKARERKRNTTRI